MTANDNPNLNKLERALADPSAVYSEPESVLNDRVLSDEEKARILRRWAFDVAELTVATEEGMPPVENAVGANEESLARRIALALGTVETGGPVAGPGKHHVPTENRRD